MKKQLKQDSYNKQSKRNQQLPSDLATNKAVKNFVFKKFKEELSFMFSHLLERKRCDILVSLSMATKCNMTNVKQILSHESILKTPQEVKCFSRKTSRYPQCRTRYKVRVLNSFWNQMAKLFNVISVPFQCNIINRIATTSLRYRMHRNTKIKAPRITLQTAEKQLEVIFPYLNIKEKCSKVWKPLKKLVPLKAPASLLNLTIKLDAGVKRKDWLRNFKKKASQMYKIYSQYYQSKRLNLRPLPGYEHNRPSNPPLLNKNDVRLTVLRVTKKRSAVSVVFGMEVKRKRTQTFSRISPAKLLLVPLKRLGTKALNLFFNATVVKLSGAQQDAGKESYVWSVPQIMESKRQFPKYLVPYYRKLDREGKCLVMLYISSHLQTDLRPVEMLYSTFKYIPRKYFCSSKRRIIIGPFANRTDIYIDPRNPRPPPPSLPKHEETQLNTTSKNMLTERLIPKRTNTSKTKESDDFPEDEEQTEERQKITPLEIVLFGILGLLCLAILAFTVNCILFTMKNKKSAPPQQVNTVFSRAVYTRATNATSEDQHVTVVLNGEIPTPRRHDNCLNTSENCTRTPKNPENGQIILSEEQIHLHSNAHSLESSLNGKDESCGEEVLAENEEMPSHVTIDISDNTSTSDRQSLRTNSQLQPP